MARQDATALLFAVGQGDRASVDRLVPLVYDELRRLAAAQLKAERPSHTLQATALAHEVYFKLIDQSRVSWAGRAHFMAVAAELIRRILVDHARARGAAKRGAGCERITLAEIDDAASTPRFDVLDLNEALAELEGLSERQAKVVELRFFAGLENHEIAEAMGISVSLVKNEWRFARAWLATRLGHDSG